MLKNLFKIFVISVFAISQATAYAGIWDAAATSDWPVKPTKRYKLDMYGYDARAYEFTTYNGLKCIAIFPGGNAQGWNLQCVEVKK